jgi:hypothetical protein
MAGLAQRPRVGLAHLAAGDLLPDRGPAARTALGPVPPCPAVTLARTWQRPRKGRGSAAAGGRDRIWSP